MAILKSASLLNLGAEATKPAASSANALTQNTGTDAFAQTLRKQMQHTGRPAMTTAKIETAKPGNLAQGNPAQASAASSQSHQASQAAHTQAEDASTAAQAAAANDAAAQETHSQSVAESSVNETPQERKKKLLAALLDSGNTGNSQAAAEQAAVAISPWMQSMLAMRPNADTASMQTEAQAGTPGWDAKQAEAALLGTKSTMASGIDQASQQLSMPPAVVATEQAGEQTTDFKQLLADVAQSGEGQATPALSDTLVNAKLMAAAQETGADKRAFSALRGSESPSDLTAIAALNAAPPLSGQLGMTAASVAQSNMVMSQIATPFGNERWQSAMNQHVMNMVSSGDEVASLTLSPPDLGPIQVVLQVDNQSVNTSFVTDNPLVRQALEDGMQDLRERMASQGLQLGQTFIGNGQQAQQHFEQQTTPQASPSLNGGQQTDLDNAPNVPVRNATPLGLVDTFV